MGYIFYDEETGQIMGGAIGRSVVHEHTVDVDDHVGQSWPLYRLNATRDDVELIGDMGQSIDKVRAVKLAEISIAWTVADSSTFLFRGHRIDAGQADQNKILHACVAVLGKDKFGAGWPGGWKTAENKFLPLATPEDLLDMQAAMVAQGTGNFNQAQKLKELVRTAQTLEELAGIKWVD